ELVEEAASLLKSGCNSGSAVTISVQREAEQVMVAADPDQLKQVFWNLGLNAIQAMPTGGQLTLAVRRHVSKNGAGWAAVAFSDTGRGIPPAEIDRIFDPFYTTRPGGTGLGLAIARKIIDSLGGKIEVVSRPGDGATFKVFLKQAAGEAGPGSRA
ncbi:MAG: two-component system sensor histidine kinase NtrB, partial [Candidatus Methylomirabilis sp.]